MDSLLKLNDLPAGQLSIASKIWSFQIKAIIKESHKHLRVEVFTKKHAENTEPLRMK